MQPVLISKENMNKIIKQFSNFIIDKIDNKDLAEKYIDLFNKADYIRIDGEGKLFLTNNGGYVEVDLDKLNLTKDNVDTIYNLFNINISNQEEGWKELKSMSSSRRELTSSIYEDKIYVIGGFNGGYSSNTNECYNVSTNTWETKKEMPTKRYTLTSSIYEDKIYCIGGLDGGFLNTNECYNVTTNTWETKKEMPSIRSYLTSNIYEDKIYVIGGYNNGTIVNTNECYNVSTNTWETKLNMPTNRYGLTSSIYKNKIYCIGGDKSPNVKINECYNVSTNTWETKVSMNNSRRILTSSIYEDKIYVIGGYTDCSVNINECYNVLTDTWETKLEMPNKSYGLTSDIYEDKIYVIGGYDNNVGYYLNNIQCYSIPYVKKDYDIDLPSVLQEKLDLIKSDGDGTKLLSDNGTYVNPVNDIEIVAEDDINEIINNCFGGEA